MSEKPQSPPVLFAPGTLEAALIAQNAVEKAAAVMVAGLSAEMRDGFPDHKHRLESAKTIMDRVEGRCVERQLIQHQHIKAPTDAATLLANPATMEALGRAADKTPGGREKLIEMLSKPAKGKAVDPA